MKGGGVFGFLDNCECTLDFYVLADVLVSIICYSGYLTLHFSFVVLIWWCAWFESWIRGWNNKSTFCLSSYWVYPDFQNLMSCFCWNQQNFLECIDTLNQVTYLKVSHSQCSRRRDVTKKRWKGLNPWWNREIQKKWPCAWNLFSNCPFMM